MNNENNKNHPAVKPMRLLVVDDNVDAADSLSALLSISGHLVETAYDGVEAINVASRFRPHVIFLDIGMPDMNGYETAERIRTTPSLEDITLVALTGWGAESDRIKSSDTGFDYHLTKPVQISQIHTLLATIENSSS